MFTIRIRGAGGTRLAAYLCPDHGAFDATVPRDPLPDTQPCPECSAPAPWTITAPLYKPQRGAVTQGKIAEKPHPNALDTRELGEGMPLGEWKKKRAAHWEEQRKKKVMELKRS